MKIDKKIKCVHCGNEIVVDGLPEGRCACGTIVVTNGIITEGVVGTDWIDISPILLNE